VVRQGAVVVAVGAIKRVRHDYAASRVNASGFRFPTGIPELGYVARHPAHKGHGFAPRIVEALVSQHAGPLWATTDSAGMKDALGRAAFERKGKEWRGVRGQLSLWLKER
jgi:RimJ/RimL family protein N-acetyltransferase